MSSSKLKLLYLIDVFHKFTDSEHRLTADELALQLKTSYSIITERKSIYRDIDALTEYGMDIVKTTSGYYLRNRRFMTAEIRLLLSAVNTAGFITEAKTKHIRETLLSYLSDYHAASMEKQANIGAVKLNNEEIYKNIESINLAISMHRRISFFYYKRDIYKNDVVQHSGKRYTVSPYAMVWLQDRYYLVCNMDGRDDLTHFRIDRMRGVYTEYPAWRHFSEVSIYTNVFDAADYASKCPNMYGGELRRVTLRCRNGIVNEVFDRYGERSVIVRADGDAHFTASVETAVSEGFFAWVAQFFGAAEVISPADVREKLTERARAFLAAYDDTNTSQS